MDGYTRQTIKRLPLGLCFLHLFKYVMAPPLLDELYERHRGRHYPRVLTLPLLVDLLGDALTEYHGSGNQAFVHAREQRRLPVSRQAAYGKLGRMPLALSCALLSHSYEQLMPLLPHRHDPTWQPPTGLQAMACIVIDGKTIKHLQKRLAVSWGQPGTVLGGKLLVAWDAKSELAVAMSADRDGERNDVPLVADLLPQVRERIDGPILWIEDRQFCNPVVLKQLVAKPGDHFLVRQTAAYSFHCDRGRGKRRGRDELGRVYWEQWGTLGSAKSSYRPYVRRISVRTGRKTVIRVLTDVLDGRVCGAMGFLWGYRRRGGIEHAFQQVTEVFHLDHLIGSTPEASIFQAAFCMTIYNMLQVGRAYTAVTHRLKTAEVSLENLFKETCRDLVAAMETVGLGLVSKSLPVVRTAKQMRHILRKLMSMEWHEWLRKSPPKKRSRPPPKGRSGQHTSMQRLLDKAKRKREREQNARLKRHRAVRAPTRQTHANRRQQEML